MTPQPKAEITVRVMTSNGELLHIWAASNDAREWLENHAPKYGNLYPPERDGHYDFFINPVFDVEEIQRYIKRMGRPA